MQVADLRCDDCGSDDLVTIAPGEDETRDLFLLVQPMPTRAWCLACWRKKAGVRAAN